MLLLQAVISVRTELVAAPVTVTEARGHQVDGCGRTTVACSGTDGRSED
jgi:hypothetical protein